MGLDRKQVTMGTTNTHI